MAWKQAPRTHVDPNARRVAPKLRRSMTEAERALWESLRREMDLVGSHFRRQVPIGPYVADFCCYRLRVIVEVDGSVHDTRTGKSRDQVRDAFLRTQGFSVIRLSNDDVLTRMPVVLERLRAAFAGTTPTPSPSPQGGGEPRGASS